MGMLKRQTLPKGMDIDTSPQMKSREPIHGGGSFPDLPSNSGILDSDISPTISKYPQKHGHNMDLEDSGGEDGGVSLNPTSFSSTFKPKGRSTTDLLSSSPHPGQPGFRRLDMDSDILSSSPSPFPRIRLKLKTDLPSSTTSNQTTPRDYIRSPLTSIPEELAIKGEGDMDVDTDLNDMPVLEDINSSDYALPSLPGSFPNSSNSFNQGYSPSTPSSQKDYEDDFTFACRPSKLSSEIDVAYSDSEYPSGPTSPTEKGDENLTDPAPLPDVYISWDLWPPENLAEKELCERVCEEVALLHNCHKVIIR
jgi:hypothetical protein